MGKVNFPLINVRKDVTNMWHMTHFTGETSELITVPKYSNEYGYFTTFLLEIPDPGSATQQYTTTPPKINGLTEFRGTPIDEKTRRIKLLPTQFFVNYQTGELLFHPNVAGYQFKVDYWGRGSLVEAEDINYLANRIQEIEDQRITPQFIDFKIDEQEEILEIGSTFPDNVNQINFKWKIDYPERIKSKSIIIENITQNIILGNNLENNLEEFSVNVNNILKYNEPNKLVFRISATDVSGRIIFKDLNIQWVDRVYWDVTPNKNIISNREASTLSFSKLLDNSDLTHELNIDLPYSVNQYKILVIPERYSLSKIIDRESGLNFVIQDPKKVSVTNIYGVVIPCYAYVSSNSICSKVKLNCKLGEEN